MKTQANIIKLSVMEERVANMCKQNETDHAEILRKISQINLKLDETYVTKSEFGPIQKLVYGMVGIFLTAIVGALVKLVVG